MCDFAAGCVSSGHPAPLRQGKEMQQDGLFAFPMQDRGNVCVSIKPDICGASWDAAISAQTATFSSLGVKEQKKAPFHETARGEQFGASWVCVVGPSWATSCRKPRAKGKGGERARPVPSKSRGPREPSPTSWCFLGSSFPSSCPQATHLYQHF